MTIVEQLQEAVWEECAQWHEENGYKGMAENLRRGKRSGVVGPALTRRLIKEIAHFFEDYEEVEVQEGYPRTILRTRACFNWDRHKPSFTIYRKKQKPPETVTVTRETLAVLFEYVKDVPNKDMVLDGAMAEAKQQL